MRFQEVPAEQAREGLRAVLPQWLADAYLDMSLSWSNKDGELTDAFERITGKKARPFQQFARDYAGAFGGVTKPVAS